jgi:hypothetical protein
MAYQDVVELAKLGSTVIVGGMLKNTLIDVAYLKANVINVSYLNALDIVSKNIRTTETGKGVEITATNNNITIYDPNRASLIEIDDDSAVVDINGTVGPGIRIGLLSGDNASVSSQGLFFKNSIGTLTSYFTKNQIYTVNILATGVTNLHDLNVTRFLSMNGTPGLTATQNIGGGFGMKFISGVYVGTVAV